MGRVQRDPLPLTIAFWDYDRTMPIADGRIGIKGCTPNCIILPPQDTFVRAFATADFDVCELSLSRQAQAIANGTNHYGAIPIFPSRTFRHSSIYIRGDRGIEVPSDLKGRRIGLRNFDDTAAVVVRGLLRDEYGLGRSDITWVIGDVDEPQRQSIERPPVGSDIKIEILPHGDSLNASLASGRIDGMIGLLPPKIMSAPSSPVRRLFPDWRTAERAYFAKTRCFPIMHVVGIRRTLLAAHPWLASSVSNAFVQAKAHALANLRNLQAPKSMLPWLVAELEDTRSAMGDDFWSYGISANRDVLKMTLRHLREDNLLVREIDVNELFVDDLPLSSNVPGGGST
jgi:4,5-dihydroxyphthalate decarboxylase